MEIRSPRAIADRVLTLLAVLSTLAILRLSRAYVVQGDSMRPTLQDGDYVHALRLPGWARRRLLSPDTIVVARRPDAPQVAVIKRVVGQDAAGLRLLAREDLRFQYVLVFVADAAP